MGRFDILCRNHNGLYVCYVVEYTSKLQKGCQRVWSRKSMSNHVKSTADKGCQLKFIILFAFFCTLKLINRRGHVRFSKDPKQLLDVLDTLGYLKLDADFPVSETHNDDESPNVNSSEGSINTKSQ